MRFVQCNLENFRNIAAAQLPLGSSSHFLWGQNAQGKSNVLEALHVVTALRSFRQSNLRLLIREGEPMGQLFFRVESGVSGKWVEETVQIVLHGKGRKELWVNGERVKQVSSFLGRFPTVAMSSQDIQLLRGSPAGRRRFMDMHFSVIFPEYLPALRKYKKALQERNAVLKDERLAAMLGAYTQMLAEAGSVVTALRERGMEELNSHLQKKYEVIAGRLESPAIVYQSDAVGLSAQGWWERLQRQEKRDWMMRATQVGAHRDDMNFLLADRLVGDYGSDGQQRNMVLALRLAQAAHVEECLGDKPVLLVDDVLVELDRERQAGFWRGVDGQMQIIATGTVLPQGEGRSDWQATEVVAGSFTSK